MKRVLAFVLVLVLSLGLCACKNKDVKNVEAMIDELNADSTYQQIYAVYSQYNALSDKEQKKVENLSDLKDYCNPRSGDFVLNDELLQELEAQFEKGDIVLSSAHIAAVYDLNIKKAMEKWVDFGDIEFSSHEKTDRYTYTGYGKVTIVDQYGNKTRENFELSYTVEYSEEETCGYTLVSNVYIR